MSKIRDKDVYREMWKTVNPVTYENIAKIIPTVNKSIMKDLKEYYNSLDEDTMVNKDLSTTFDTKEVREEMRRMLDTGSGFIDTKSLLTFLSVREESLEKLIKENKIEKVNDFINYLVNICYK